MRILRNLLLPLLGICLAASLAGSVFMLHVALDRATCSERPSNVLRRLSQRGAFLTHWIDSISRTKALRDTFIVAAAGRRLHAWYLRAPSPTPRVALLLHGYGDQGLEMLHIGYLYHHGLGFNVVLPDLHAHGQSDGRHIRMGWLDRLDALRWAEVADSLFGGETHMVVHGISMGAATTMMLSGEPTPPCIRAFVEDCGYTSVWDEFGSELRQRYGLPPFPLLQTSSLLCRLRHGWGFREASALKQVARCQRPMLFIHGDQDTFVPTWMVRPLFEAHPGPKRLWLVPGVAHADAFWAYPEEYTRRVKEFLEECGTVMESSH